MPLELGIAFGTDAKEGLRPVSHKEPGEIQIAAARLVNRSLHQQRVINHIYLVRLVAGDVDKTGGIGALLEILNFTLP